MLVTAAFLDGQFGFLSPAPRASVVIAPSTSGTTNTLISVTDKAQVQSTWAGGPLVESLAFRLANGSGPAYGMRLATNAAGTVSTVTDTLVGSSDGDLAISGSPADAFNVIVLVTRSGKVAGTPPSVQISYDGGQNYTVETSVPVGGVLTPTEPVSGLTFTFTNSTVGFVAGDKFTFTTTAPTWNSTNLTAALDALRADATNDYEYIHIVGPASSAIFSVCRSALNLFAAEGRYPWILLEARDNNSGESEDTWMASIKSEFSASQATYGEIVVVAGFGYHTSAISGRTYWRSLANAVSARVSNADLAEHLGKTKAGSLPGLVLVNNVVMSHDERRKPGLATERFLTVQTLPGKGKLPFIGDPARRSPATMASSTSDFRKVHFMRVARYTIRIAVEAATDLLGEQIETNPNGTILGRFANEVEGNLKARLAAQLVPKHLQDVDVHIDRTINMKTAERFPLSVRMNSYAYAEWIDITVAFSNPNLVTVAAA